MAMIDKKKIVLHLNVLQKSKAKIKHDYIMNKTKYT